MSEEEIINKVDKFIDTVTVILSNYSTKIPEYCIDEEAWIAIKGLLDLYNKEKEKNKPKPDAPEPVERTEKMVNMKWVNHNYISKDKAISVEELAEKLLILEDYSKATKEQVMSMIDTILDENNRLEDIEDRKVQIEYNLVYNKGYQDCKTKYLNKIREKIKELEDRKFLLIDEQDYYERSGLDEQIEILEELLEE